MTEYTFRNGKILRTGFTTGICAAAAAKAAVTMLLTGESLTEMEIFWQADRGGDPDGRWDPAASRNPVRNRKPAGTGDGTLMHHIFPLEEIEVTEELARCGVRKDAGDDADVTDGLLIMAEARFADWQKTGEMPEPLSDNSFPADPQKLLGADFSEADRQEALGAGFSEADRQEALRSGSNILILGGEGIGRVTLPGLDRPEGEAAINSGPRRMIREAVRAAIQEYEEGSNRADIHESASEAVRAALQESASAAARATPHEFASPAARAAIREPVSKAASGIIITISEPEGRKIAAKTFNPLLGIEGGISILGTSGIVDPMSGAAAEESVRTEVRVRCAQMRQERHRDNTEDPSSDGDRKDDQSETRRGSAGNDPGQLVQLVLAPGNTGAAFAEQELGLARNHIVLCSNYFGAAIDEACLQGVDSILLIGALGKMIKLAGGIFNTHSYESDARLDILMRCALQAGADTEVLREMDRCITTEAAMVVLQQHELDRKTAGIVCSRALEYIRRRCGRRGDAPDCGMILLSNRGSFLAESEGARNAVADFEQALLRPPRPKGRGTRRSAIKKIRKPGHKKRTMPGRNEYGETEMIYFVGAGSGSPDLITVRGRRLLDAADVIIYAGSLVNPELLEGIRENAEVHNSAYLDLEQVMEIMFRAHEGGKMLVRLHTGDPSIYGAVREQMDRLEERQIPYEVCPGVSSFSGAAASLKAEYTLPGVSQTLILTRLEGRTPVPPREKIRDLASHGASMAIFLSAGMTERLQTELLASGGYGPDTPCAVVYKATWPEEKIVRTELQNLAEETARAGIRKTALILVGGFLGSDYELSKLYDKHFATEFRPAAPTQTGAARIGTAPAPEIPEELCAAPDPEEHNTAPDPSADMPDSYKGRRVLRVTALCFTDRGETLGRKLDDVRVLRHGRDFTKTSTLAAELFETEDAILFISAAGIAVRSIAKEVCGGSKQRDPAVLVLDEGGQFVIPVLSGHLGGANALAEEVAERLGSRAVLTTASDSRGIESIDLIAQRGGYYINDMAAAKSVTAAMLRGRPAGIRRVPDPAEPAGAEAEALEIRTNPPAVTLTLTPKRYVLGIGCRRDTAPDVLLDFVREELRRLAIPEERIYAVCSIEEKAGERAIHRAARHFHSPFLVFTAEQLEQMPGTFTGSEFVKQTVGTDNVCERSAMAGCGGRFEGFVLRKTAGSGVTLAVARRKPDPSRVETAAVFHAGGEPETGGKRQVKVDGRGEQKRS